ncbi:hypothetical protein EVAR_35289_1 [Eumeta japonica]|uniref:Uncharacterized protein n=1 Tax=Eumeta variegata TaxID=151549 RepID=A0A4C1XM91_EUMVA|nr:hypothetical protein EVAR_35289_1 [Eumeta japonica]
METVTSLPLISNLKTLSPLCSIYAGLCMPVLKIVGHGCNCFTWKLLSGAVPLRIVFVPGHCKHIFAHTLQSLLTLGRTKRCAMICAEAFAPGWLKMTTGAEPFTEPMRSACSGAYISAASGKNLPCPKTTELYRKFAITLYTISRYRKILDCLNFAI